MASCRDDKLMMMRSLQSRNVTADQYTPPSSTPQGLALTSVQFQRQRVITFNCANSDTTLKPEIRNKNARTAPCHDRVCGILTTQGLPVDCSVRHETLHVRAPRRAFRLLRHVCVVTR